MANNNVFVIDDGTREVSFQNKFGQPICTMHIRTGDIGIIDRYNKMMDGIGDVLEPLRNMEMNSDGTSDFEDDWAKIKEVEKKIIEQINELFDTTEAGNLFETRHAFSTVNGEFYVSKVLSALGDLVNEDIKEEARKTEKRMEKYLKDNK